MQDQAIIAVSHKTVQLGGGVAVGAGVAGWLTDNYLIFTSIGVLTGIGAAIIGLAVQFTYSWRRDKREQAEHERRMRI